MQNNFTNQDPLELQQNPQFQQQTSHGKNEITVYEKNQAVNIPNLVKPAYPLPDFEEWSIRFPALFCFGAMVPSAIAALPGVLGIFISLSCLALLITLTAWASLSPYNRAIASSAFLFFCLGVFITVIFMVI